MSFDTSLQRQFFTSGATLDLEFRKESLRKLKTGIKKYEEQILAALHTDLKKPVAEAYVSEIGFIYEEINYTLKHLENWARPQKVLRSISSPLGKCTIHSEPLGVVLILSPWNYPFQLLIAPLIGAIAAGNCAVLKPSELALATSAIARQLIEATFEKNYIQLLEGGVEVSKSLLELQWDHIFFTGGTEIGKSIMAAASKHLTPVTLELGGKSPCIVDASAPLETSARRIAWGKFFNAGQTCVAPDYVFVHHSIKERLVEALREQLKILFGENPQKSPDYGRIISERHFDRLTSLIQKPKVVLGGEHSREEKYIAPTIMAGVQSNDLVMQSEIFGPILPLLDYQNIDEIFSFIKQHPKPLASYLFSKDAAIQKRWTQEVSFGGGCINDTLIQLTNMRLPFGGVGTSGMGAYHGKYTFDTFSHRKSVVKNSFFLDLKLRYPPYKNALSTFRKFMK